MSGEFGMYHALGQHELPPSASSDKSKNQQPAWRPPVAASPSGYQQSGSSHGSSAPNPPAPGYNASPQDSGYFPPQSAQQQGTQGDVAGVTTQMGDMGIGAPAAHNRPKKKDRHAYHAIEAPIGSSQAFNGIPQGQMGAPSQFLNQSPSMSSSQFPVPANPNFTPANPASPMQHAARSSTPLQGAPISSNQGRVDPEHIPSIPRSRDAPAQHYLQHVYPTMEKHLPPPASIPFVAYDQGNASPKFARLTLNNIPSSSDSLASTNLPLGLVLQPLAPLQEGETAIPVLDFGDTGPPRCRRCRTYINPFMTFRSGGNRFVCNMCSFPNEVPSEYFAPTDVSGIRVDRAQRPELALGTVEFTVPKEYWNKEPVGLRWLFVIDVSAEAVNRGYLHGFCEGILSALYNPGEEKEETSESEKPRTSRLAQGSKVGFVTFDKEVHFYNISPGLDRAQMMVMTDIEDPFVPLSEGLFVDPDESKAVITSLLKQLPNMFADVKNPEPALLPTLNAALSALTITGGKIVCSLASLPTWGPGRLFLRDDGNMHNTDAEKKLLTTEHPGWRKTAQKMVESGVGTDFFLAAPSGGYLDIATIGMATPIVTSSFATNEQSRSRSRTNWRRHFLLPQFPFSSGYTEAGQRNTAYPDKGNWLPGTDEGKMLARAAGVRLPWQFLSSHVRCRPRVRRNRRRQGDRRPVQLRREA